MTSPFDLERGPLLRAHILQTGDNSHQVMLSSHHIVCDGWSMDILLHDLGKLYTSRLTGESSELSPADSFSAYADASSAYLISKTHHDNRDYWLRKFAPLATFHDLPTDFLRKPMRNLSIDYLDYKFSPSQEAAIKKQSARDNLSIFNLVLGHIGWTFLAKSGREFVFGVPFADQSVSNKKHLVGHCVNFIPLVVRPASDGRKHTVMRELQTEIVQGFDHCHFTYGSLVKSMKFARDPARIPLFSVVFTHIIHLASDALDYQDLTVNYVYNNRQFGHFELYLTLVEYEDQLQLNVAYATRLFEKETIRALIDDCFADLT